MFLIQSDATKSFSNVSVLDPAGLKKVLGSSDIIAFTDDQFKPLIDLLDVIGEDYQVVIDVPNVSTSPVVLEEKHPDRLIAYVDFLKSRGTPESEYLRKLKNDPSKEDIGGETYDPAKSE